MAATCIVYLVVLHVRVLIGLEQFSGLITVVVAFPSGAVMALVHVHLHGLHVPY